MSFYPPSGRFNGAVRPDHDRPLDKVIRKHKCAAFGPQAHLRRLTDTRAIELLVAPCLRWSCAACGPEILLPRLRQELVKAVQEHGLLCWITLTLVREGTPGPARTAKRLTGEWKSLRDLYRKRFGHSLRCVWLKEVADGWAHLHLFSEPIDRRWLKAAWHRLTGAHQVKAVLLDGDDEIRVRVGYAVKSICENAKDYGTSCGRWRGASKGIRLQVRPKGKPGSGWRVVHAPIDVSNIPAGSYQVRRVDRVGRPTHVLVNPREVIDE